VPYQADPNFAQSAAEFLLHTYGPATTQLDQAVPLFVPNTDEVTLDAVLANEISAPVAISETLIGLSAGKYWLDGIDEEYDERVNASLTLRLTPRDPRPYWVIGVAGYSEWGTTTFSGSDERTHVTATGPTVSASTTPERYEAAPARDHRRQPRAGPHRAGARRARGTARIDDPVRRPGGGKPGRLRRRRLLARALSLRRCAERGSGLGRSRGVATAAACSATSRSRPRPPRSKGPPASAASAADELAPRGNARRPEAGKHRVRRGRGSGGDRRERLARKTLRDEDHGVAVEDAAAAASAAVAPAPLPPISGGPGVTW
jgi:hypothetical protein